jgi:parallel beta-helix repeat protein
VALLAAGLIVMSLGAGRANAASVWFISSDTTLQSDYSGQIVIVGQGATLNCAGHTVSGDGRGVGINVAADSVTVTQCQVQGFDAGILTTRYGTQALGNVLTHNGEGIRIAGATGDTLSGNTANLNNRWGIIVAEGASGNTVSGNTANNNGIIGIALNATSYDAFSNNTANHNGSDGINLLASSNNQLANNTANSNGNAGFDLQTSSSQNTLAGNVANNNGAPGNGFGFEFGDASSNTVTGNAAFHNSGVGFFAFFGSQFNLITQNKGCQNFYVDAADISTGAGNTWSNNAFCTTGDGI